MDPSLTPIAANSTPSGTNGMAYTERANSDPSPPNTSTSTGPAYHSPDLRVTKNAATKLAIQVAAITGSTGTP